MRTALAISGTGHVALILWAVIGGVFQRPPEADLRVTEVTVLSGEQFAALSAPAAGGAPDAADDVPPAPEAPVPPEPRPEPPAEAPPPRPAPEPEPAPTPDPDSSPDLSALTEPLPETEVAPAPPTPQEPPAPEPSGAATLAPEVVPAPRPAPRVAPLPAPAPEPDAAIAEETTTAPRPEPTDTAVVEPEPEPEAAPPEAATRIEPDAADPDGGAPEVALAPTGSPRPAARPRRAAPATETATASTDRAATATPEPAPSGAGTGGAGTEPVGPPMTAGERDALRVSVQRCWNVGSLSSEALRTTVTVFVSMNRDGTPDPNSLRMTDFSGGTEAAARRAYEAARRAILRCGSRGFDLPTEKYGQWREIEMVFNPDGMRLR